MYKDKDKQREANRARQQRRRDAIKAKGVTNTGCDGQGVTVPTVKDLAEEFVRNSPKPKRGKDIKCFEDLPPDVQRTIDKMSMDCAGGIDMQVHKRRTAIAIDYQHKHPDRYEPTSLPSHCVMTESEREGYKPAAQLKAGGYNHVSKPGDADYDGVCTEEWRAERGR